MGVSHRYRPDFVVRLQNGLVVLLEGKGDADEKDDAKATSARRWVEAVNTWGSYSPRVGQCGYVAGLVAGGSQGPVVNSCPSASMVSMPHLVAVDR